MWFKVYLTAGVYHEPSTLSRTIYVEVINQHGHLVQTLKLFSLTGSTAGSLPIPDSLASGNYLVRAYTNWMRNSGEEYFFHRSIKIWNSESSTTNNNHDIKDNELDSVLRRRSSC